MRAVFSTLVGTLAAASCLAGEVQYRPGGAAFDKAWQQFYVLADHEPEIDDPLIARGHPMVLAICEAIRHKDMLRRRYAIGALGFIKDWRALPTLEFILKDGSEIEYFRGDALQSIYQIDRPLGHRYANQYRAESKYLTMISEAILKDEPWLVRPTTEGE